MCREPMLVLRMVVIGVGVDVQRSALAGGRGHDQSEQDRDKAVHDFESMGAVERRQTDRRPSERHPVFPDDLAAVPCVAGLPMNWERDQNTMADP